MNQIIEMVRIEDFIPKKEGVFKHLVKTESIYFKQREHVSKSYQYLQAVITVSDKGVSVGINNQTVTHISKNPLYD